MLPRILIALVIVAAIVYVFRPKPRFIVRIRDGRPIATRGKVPAAFLADCQRALDELNIHGGTIKGYGPPHRTTLKFSRQIPVADHQSLRNVWHLYSR